MLDSPGPSPSQTLPLFTPEALIAFERMIADAYSAAMIKAPVHLSGGNEQQLIDIFKQVKPEDWCFSTWRSHYHALLKGVPGEQLMEDILAGHSITLNYKDQRVVTSAIVGGICPIALGVAWSIKRRLGHERVWCFVGDMTAHTGTFHECWSYAIAHRLPINFVIEDNGKSVCTDTAEVWNSPIKHHTMIERSMPVSDMLNGVETFYYAYELTWPHSGIGTRINF